MAALRTIESCLTQAAIALQNISDSPRLDAEVLLSNVLHRNRTYLYAYSDSLVDEAVELEFFQQVARRKSGEPVAHITGSREFWSLPLSVNNSTLIPRPDTELLVETALAICQQDQARVLQLGTGTGANAVPTDSCFDLIVSNPPYIAKDDPHLLEGDVRFEPRSALIAADDGYADLFFFAREAI